VHLLADRLAHQLGQEMHDARIRRAWQLGVVADRAGLAASTLHAMEAGSHASISSYVRVALALGLTPSFTLSSRPTARPAPATDAVHAAMGEMQAAHLRDNGWEVLLDEPYQHYQFAGRADLLAVDRGQRAILHIENRTRFPDLQAFAGAYNAKRAYLVTEVARRFELAGGFRSVTHVVAALWSSEVLHVLRLRPASFTALCPDPPDAFGAWWNGAVPPPGIRSSIVLFDPLPGTRRSRRRWVGLEAVARANPRYRGYAHALESLREARQA
jgi:hypothetical protein